MLQKHGHWVEVVCPPIPWMVEALSKSEIKTHTLDMKSGAGLPAQFQMLSIVRKGKFDIIHAHLSRATYLGFVSSTITGIPLISTVHVETKEPIYKWVGRGRNRLIAVSNYIHGVLVGRGAKADAIEVVYNGTDFANVQVESDEAVHKEFGIPLDRQIIGLVGRVAPEKGHHIALEALPTVLQSKPRTQLMFVGRTDGDFADQLTQEAVRLGVRDHLTFTGNRSDVPRLFDAMSFSILPTVMESFGLAVIECMARGRPVVASNVGALAELVQHEETGLLVEQNSRAFSEAMLALLADPEKCREMGRNARMVIQEKFTVEQMIERLEGCYEKVATRKK